MGTEALNRAPIAPVITDYSQNAGVVYLLLYYPSHELTDLSGQHLRDRPDRRASHGEPFPTMVSEQIRRPMGAESLALLAINEDGYIYAGGGVTMRAGLYVVVGVWPNG